jgi:hypothetical protein
MTLPNPQVASILMVMAAATVSMIEIVHAQEARRLSCTGAMIAPSALTQAPKTVKLTIGPGREVTYDLGEGQVTGRTISNNKIQLKFRGSDFEGEYFHYTGDLFFIYKSGHLMRLTCNKE